MSATTAAEEPADSSTSPIGLADADPESACPQDPLEQDRSREQSLSAVGPSANGSPAADGETEVTLADPDAGSSRRLVADSLASAVATMFLLTVVQRGTGFFRSILVCRFLTPEDLGYWNMAKSFLVLAAPLIVLGLPGSFKRYLAYYRARGQLENFLRQTSRVTTGLTLAGVALTILFREQIAWATFGTTRDTSIMLPIAFALLFVIAFNCGVELLLALRQIRAVSFLQLINSLVFTVVSLALIVRGGMRAEGVVLGFAVANLVTAIGAMVIIRRALASEVSPEGIAVEHEPRGLWQKLAPFAAWFWLADLLGNLFSNVDRMMIVHFADARNMDGLALVGQYHSSQIIGLLLAGLTGILGGILLSYLSHDWETGQQDKATHTLDFAMKLISLALTAAAACALMAAPIIFTQVLDNRYNAGLEVLPMTMSYCIWCGLLGIANNFLWCREKASLVSLALAIGLTMNVVLNYFWLPVWGLSGAVAATAVSNLSTLIIVFWMGKQLGMKYSVGALVAIAAPGSLCFGGLPALGTVAIIGLLGTIQGWLFTEFQYERLATLLDDAKARARSRWFRQAA